MRAVSQHIHGRLGTVNGRTALLLLHSQPEAPTADSLYLRFAFVTRGREEPIFPAFIMDDWGNEIRGLKLYNWVAEEGEQFPRAEIFGFEANGEETQCFLRALELHARPLCYVYVNRDDAVEVGQRVEMILVPDTAVTVPEKIKRPAEGKRPLLTARVSWWRIPPHQTQVEIENDPRF